MTNQTTTKTAHTPPCLNPKASDAGWKVAFCPHCNGEVRAPDPSINADLLAAAYRGVAALEANGAPNCEAAKELRAAIAKAEGR